MELIRRLSIGIYINLDYHFLHSFKLNLLTNILFTTLVFLVVSSGWFLNCFQIVHFITYLGDDDDGGLQVIPWESWEDDKVWDDDWWLLQNPPSFLSLTDEVGDDDLPFDPRWGKGRMRKWWKQIDWEKSVKL